jgi:hypothetical protein
VIAQVAEQRKPPTNGQLQYEIIDAQELAVKLRVPKSWILEQTRSRATDPLPCLRFGRYVRFRWGSRELDQWLERRAGGRKLE